MARYNYEIDGRTVKCISSYEGKPVIGIAKCDPRDTFDEETGKVLAKLRCDLKVAEKRCKRADKKELASRMAMFKAQDIHGGAMEYLYNAFMERDQLRVEIGKLSNTLAKVE